MPSKEEVVEVLKTIIDPELYVDIYTLGLIYEVKVVEDKLDVLMTFTSPACPAGTQIAAEIKEKTQAMEGVSETNIDVTFNPPWEPSEELKDLLGIG